MRREVNKKSSLLANRAPLTPTPTPTLQAMARTVGGGVLRLTGHVSQISCITEAHNEALLRVPPPMIFSAGPIMPYITSNAALADIESVPLPAISLLFEP